MKGFPVCGKAGDKITSGIDAVTAYNQNGRSIKSRGEQIAGFTLVEVTLAFGVAAFCFLALFGFGERASRCAWYAASASGRV
jgi:hypothetical protein